MDERDDEAGGFVVPPLPLASGQRLPEPDGRRIRAVRLVVTTEDGEQTDIPLRAEHGAWWAPRS